MPNNLTPIEELRYFYLQMGNVFSYNRDFLNAKSYQQVNSIYNDFITIDMIEKGDYQNKINAICKQFSEGVSETVNRANRRNQRIKTRIVGYIENEDEHHVEVVATIGEENYCLSIDKDLYRIQKGMKTKGFATSDTAVDGTKCKILSEEEVKTIDEKLGYCNNGMYTDDIIQC